MSDYFYSLRMLIDSMNGVWLSHVPENDHLREALANEENQ